MQESQRAGPTFVEAVTAPLGFFVLALLIVESFLAAAVIGGGLQEQQQDAVLWMGVGMFVLVVTTVAVLVWKKPENLTFDKQAHLTRSSAGFGTDSQPVPDRDALLPIQSSKKGGK